MSRELLGEYQATTDRYDELFEAPNTPRAHWKPMIEQIAAWPVERMRDRLHSVHSQVRENGVTYNVYADPQGADRPWELDMVPLLIGQEIAMLMVMVDMIDGQGPQLMGPQQMGGALPMQMLADPRQQLAVPPQQRQRVRAGASVTRWGKSTGLLLKRSVAGSKEPSITGR